MANECWNGVHRSKYKTNTQQACKWEYKSASQKFCCQIISATLNHDNEMVSNRNHNRQQFDGDAMNVYCVKFDTCENFGC